MSVADFIEVFTRDIIKHHNMSEVLVTDRDKLFMLKQWTSFCFHMQCCWNISTAFHLQTDDQTERQNQSLKVYLHIFVDEQQENWVKLLPCTEFFYNNFIYAVIDMSLFQLNLEWDSQMSLSRLPIRHSQGQIRLYADAQHLQDQITTAQNSYNKWTRSMSATIINTEQR